MPGPPVDDPLVAALKALAAWCAACRMPYAVIGGIAVSLQAVPRATRDVDAIACVDEARWPEILAQATAFRIQPRVADALVFAAQTRVLLLRHADGVPLDVSCGLLPFEQELVAGADTIDVGGARLRVATPAHLLVLKAVANRLQDWADVETLLQAHPGVDVVAARRVVAEFVDALEAPEILTTFDAIVARRGRR